MGSVRAGIVAMVAAGLVLAACGCERQAPSQVVVYTSVDQNFSEPVFTDFEQATGIRVRAVYDTEATKTAGMVNRLIAEKDHPQADVFWNSEIVRTLVLKEKGVLAPYVSPSAVDIPDPFKDKAGYWTGFAARLRVLVVNTAMVSEAEQPDSIFQLAEEKWRGKVALAYPLFGTAAAHAAALFVALGDEKAKAYFEALKRNDVVIVDGNSTACNRVANGQLPVAFTDTDDVAVAIKAGKPVRMVFPDDKGIGTLLIPNTVALVAGGPNPANGRKLIDFLLSREVESRLSFSGSLQIPVRPGVKTPPEVPSLEAIKVMRIDYEEAGKKMEACGKFLQQVFVR